MSASEEDIPPGYFVDAQGDVTWGGVSGSPYLGRPPPVLPKEADIRYRNFRFPDAGQAANATARRPDPVIPLKLVRDPDVADWTAFIEQFRRG
jgi:hypothetical protein